MDSTTYVPCIGAHYTNEAYAGSFDPSHPSELLYDGTAPDSKIVGLSYLVNHPNGPPPGFAGPNDHWHQHNANGGLCLKGGYVVGGEADTPAQCAAAGGHKALLINIWMLHAWVVPGYECTWGVFSGECPQLGGRLGGNAFDPPRPQRLGVEGRGQRLTPTGRPTESLRPASARRARTAGATRPARSTGGSRSAPTSPAGTAAPAAGSRAAASSVPTAARCPPRW